MSSSYYDPPTGHYASNANAAEAQKPGDPKLQGLQNKLNDTILSMQKNVEDAEVRDEQLNRLGRTTGELHATTNSFSRNANRLRKRMWWKDMKMRIWIIVGIIIILLLIIIPSVILGRK